MSKLNISKGAVASPYKEQLDNSYREQKDRSITSEVVNNGAAAGVAPLNSTSSLNGSMPENDAIFSVLETLIGGSPEEKSTALMETHNLLKESESINEENSYDLLSAVMGITEEEDTELVSKALKVLDKFLVYQPDYMAPHCEEVITKIVRAKFSLQNAETEVLYQLLVVVYKMDAVLDLVIPMLQNETYPTLLPVINLLYTTLKQNNAETQSLLESRLTLLTSAVCPLCSHVETNVRKQSIFCLVELLLVFGTEKVDSLLEPLTVSQKKLVYLYYNRHQRNVR